MKPSIDAIAWFLVLFVAILGHGVFWQQVVTGVGSVPLVLVWVGSQMIWLCQPHGETNPAVVALVVLLGYMRATCHETFAKRGAPFKIGTLSGILSLMLFSPESQFIPLSGGGSFDSTSIALKLSSLAAILPTKTGSIYLGNAPVLILMAALPVSLIPIRFLVWRRTTVTVCAVVVLASIGVAAFGSESPELYRWWQYCSAWAVLPFWLLGLAAASGNLLGRTAAKSSVGIVVSLIGMHLFDFPEFGELFKLSLAALFASWLAKLDKKEGFPKPFSAYAPIYFYGMHTPLMIAIIVIGFPWYIAILIIIAATALLQLAIDFF